MRFTRLALAVAFMVLPVSAEAQAPTRSPIFRYIRIAPFGRIDLGREFAQAPSLGEPVAPRLFRLKGPDGTPARFGDTEEILVEISEAQNVVAFYFHYLPGRKTLDERVAEYRSTLGPPAVVAYDSAGARVRRRTWTDAATSFELLEVRDGTASRLLATLRDRMPAEAGKRGS